MTSLRQGWNRRDFLRLGAAAGAGATLATSSSEPVSAAAVQTELAPTAFNETSIAQLQAAMASRQMSAVELTTWRAWRRHRPPRQVARSPCGSTLA